MSEELTFEKMEEVYSAATKTMNPPPNAELKEIEPGVFAWIERTNDPDDGTTE